MKLPLRSLGTLEREVMVVVWRNGCVTVRCVFEKLLKSRGLAYTTVMTTMDRLTKKGLLRRSKIGKAYEYKPTQTKEQYHVATAQALINNLVRQYGDVAIAQFVDAVDHIDTKKFEELKQRVNAHQS